LALESWAGSLTESTESEKIGDYSYSRKSADNKLKLAARYRQQDVEMPSMAWASFNFTDIEEDE